MRALSPHPPEGSGSGSSALGAGMGALCASKDLSFARVNAPADGPKSQLLALCVYNKQTVSTGESSVYLGQRVSTDHRPPSPYTQENGVAYVVFLQIGGLRPHQGPMGPARGPFAYPRGGRGLK